MDYSEALKKISQMEEGADILAAIKAQTDSLTNDRKSVSVKLADTKEKLNTITSLLGVQGDSAEDLLKASKESLENLQSQVGESTKKIEEINKENAKLKEDIAKKDKAVNLSRVAAIANIHPSVLEAVATDEEFEIRGEKVFVKEGEGDFVEFDEFAQKKDSWQPFLKVLTPSEKIRIPKGGANGSSGGNKEQSKAASLVNAKIAEIAKRF